MALEALAPETRNLIDGQLVASGSPLELYRRPPTLTVARLLGELSPLPPGPDDAQAHPRWIRPERVELVTVDHADARCTGWLISRRCVGPLWEHELRVAQLTEPVLVARARPWEGSPTCGLTWADEDILELPP